MARIVCVCVYKRCVGVGDDLEWVEWLGRVWLAG